MAKEKSYRVRHDITPEQIAAAIDALNPFYGFGCVLDTANEEKGSASICFYDGTTSQETADDCITLEAVEPDGCVMGISGHWERVPAVYCGPILRAKDFFAARDAFMACIENVKSES